MTDTVVDTIDVGELFDPTDATYRADPYVVYRRLLDAGRVHRSVLGTAVLVRYDDCRTVLHHPDVSSDQTNSSLYKEAVEQGLFEHDEEALSHRPFLFLDPPDHTRLRRLVSKAFTPRRIEALRPRLVEIVDGLLEPLGREATVDVISAVAYPLPVQAICELLGVPPEDHVRFGEWSQHLARALDPDYMLPPDVVEQRENAINSFHDYFRELIAVRRMAPTNDLLSGLIEAEDAGDRLTERELLSTLILLLVAGHETTVNLITNGVYAFLRNPGELDRLRADRELLPAAVEEVLRWDPPVQIDGRTILRDVEIDGLRFHAGQSVMMLLGAANRDAHMFPDPERFDIGRTDNLHISFGHGIHHCLGAALARAEGQVALGALVDRFDHWELATDTVHYKENLVLRGLEALPVHFAPSGVRT